MRIIAATVSFLLALAGCHEGPVTTSVVRAKDGGVDLLHSRTTIRAGEGVFRCLASASGQCHYAVFATACDGGADGCAPRRLHAFAVAAGQEKRLDGLPRDARPCVESGHEPRAAECLR